MATQRTPHAPWSPSLALPGIAVLVLLVALLAPLRAILVGGTGFLTPSPTHVGTAELFFGGATSMGDGSGFVILESLLAIYLVQVGRRIDAVWVVVVCAGASLISRVAKDVYLAPRPPTMDQALQVPHAIPGELLVAIVIGLVAIAVLRGWGRTAILGAAIVAIALLLDHADRFVPVTPGYDSFPSGHAIHSATIAAALVLAMWSDTRWRWPALIAATIYVALVGASRLYLGVHYPADVLAGWSLAVAWTVATWSVKEWILSRSRPVPVERPPSVEASSTGAR